MTRKLVLLVFAMAMTVLSITLTPKTASAACSGDCSGDDCGCGVDAQECIAECNATYATGTPERLACGQACTREDIACARACCACN
jgi:hypothetical protein